MQAIVLAAGMGKRLRKEMNKCMVEVKGITLWDRMICSLKKANITKVIVVTGYRAEQLEEFILRHSKNMEIIFVRNEEYEKTNNIWSFYMAHNFFEEDTILLESDLIFEENLIKKLCEDSNLNVAVLAKYGSWMDGTTVQLENNQIKQIISKKEMYHYDLNSLYKTVNIYKFSKNFLKEQYFPALCEYILQNGKNEYYEMVLKKMVEDNKCILHSLEIEGQWYEIDTEEDLENVENLFC